MANVPAGSGNSDLMPGPLIKARVGDQLRVHFKNLDTAFNRPHSMHFHGVEYKPSSDGAYVPGYSGRDGDVKPGQTWTYKLTAGKRLRRAPGPTTTTARRCTSRSRAGCSGCSRSSAGASSAPDREYVVDLLADGQVPGDRRPRVRRQHARVPVARRRARPVGRDGDGLRAPHLPRPRPPLARPGRRPVDTVTVGPAESLRVRWRESDPGTWLYHCHVETHMEAGMIGTYQVARLRGRGRWPGRR